MFWITFIKVALIHLFGVMGPGPDLAVVLQNVKSYGKKHGVATALGTTTSILIHCSYVVFGIGVLSIKYPMILTVFRFAGVIYLLFVSFRFWRNSFKHNVEVDRNDEIEELPKSTYFKSYWSGFLTNILNLDAGLFMIMIFTQVVPKNTSLIMQIPFLLEMVLMTALWFSFVSIYMSKPKTLSFLHTHKVLMDRVLGTLVLLVVIKLLLGF